MKELSSKQTDFILLVGMQPCFRNVLRFFVLAIVHSIFVDV